MGSPVCVPVFLCKCGNAMSLWGYLFQYSMYTIFTIFVYFTLWKVPEYACSQVIISKKIGMVALLNSSSGIKVISRIGPTMPGMKQILWLPERHTHTSTHSIKKTGTIRQFLTPFPMLNTCFHFCPQVSSTGFWPPKHPNSRSVFLLH